MAKYNPQIFPQNYAPPEYTPSPVLLQNCALAHFRKIMPHSGTLPPLPVRGIINPGAGSIPIPVFQNYGKKC